MIQFVRPSRGHVTQPFANRQPDGNPHAGQDYAYSNGREIFPEVYAAADGKVLFAGDSRGLAWPNIMYVNIDFDRSDNQDSSAGNYTIIQHYENGVPVALTGYGHQEEVWVKAGQWVTAGQRIGTVGATGFSFGKHLHFDLVLAPFDVDDAPFYGRVDPNRYISGLSYAGSVTQSGKTTPKEWDEMATKEEIFEAVWGGPGTPLIHNIELGRGEYPRTTLGALTDRIVRQQIVPFRQEVAAQNAQIANLISALANVSKGEAFDEAKLLAGVQAAAEAGVKSAIDSIETTETTTVTIKEADQ